MATGTPATKSVAGVFHIWLGKCLCNLFSKANGPFTTITRLSMHIHTTSPAPLTFAQQENTKQIAYLRDDASDGHIAEHIRGIVAATLESLSVLGWWPKKVASPGLLINWTWRCKPSARKCVNWSVRLAMRC